MNAVNPLQPQPQGDETRPYEPSMEEILASIRRIIADDQSLSAGSPSREAPPIPRREPPREPTFEPQRPAITRVFDASAPSAMPPSRAEPASADARAPDQVHNTGLTEARARISDESVAPPQARLPDDTATSPSLSHPQPSHESSVPPATTTATSDPSPSTPSDGFDEGVAYVETPIEQDEPAAAADSRLDLFSASTHHSVASSFGLLAATRLADNSDELLGLAREMIRPMLKTWLDDNLPSMVERMVRAPRSNGSPAGDVDARRGGPHALTGEGAFAF